MDEKLRDEVLAAYAAYLKAFLANDVRTLDSLMHYPVAFIGNGKTRLFDRFPINPAEMMAAKQMHTTIDANYEVVFATDKKAHLILHNAKRVKADGTLIETVSAFYALTRTSTGWKFFALSDMTVAAGDALA
jgi:hypothetical protein